MATPLLKCVMPGGATSWQRDDPYGAGQLLFMLARYEQCGLQVGPQKRYSNKLGVFALAVIKQFRANQGVLLAGAVAPYTR